MKLKLVNQLCCCTAYSLSFLVVDVALHSNTIKAQMSAVNTSSIPLNDQARYLKDLKNISISQWALPEPNQAEVAAKYRLNFSNSELKITEHIPATGANTGEDPHYSVLVNVYKFNQDFDFPSFDN